MRSRHPSSVEATVRRESPWAMTAIGVFLFFGAVMASLAGTTLIWPGTLLDHVWVVNAPAGKLGAVCLGHSVSHATLAWLIHQWAES